MRKSQSLVCLALIMAWGLLLTAGSPVVAQRGGDSKTTKRKARKKPRGRLPAYYAKVVTTTQRKEIYDIQAKYEVEIAKLRKQLAQMIMDRDQEVSEVLSPEQLKQVSDLKAAAKAKRRKRRAAKRAGSGTTRRRTKSP